MTMGHFGLLYGAETKKLFGRLSARLGLVAVAVSAVLAVLIIRWADGSGFTWQSSVNGEVANNTLGDQFSFEGADGAVAAIWPRNALFVGRIFLIMLGALITAGELQSRTLREDLLRPVPRWSVLMAKFGALATWSAVSLVLCATFALALSVPLFGVGGAWGQTALAYVATFLGDCMLIALVLLTAVIARSVSGTLVALVLFWVANSVAGWALWALWKVAGIFSPDFASDVQDVKVWLPGSALDVWTGYALDEPWAWQSFLVLFATWALALLGSLVIFERRDVL